MGGRLVACARLARALAERVRPFGRRVAYAVDEDRGVVRILPVFHARQDHEAALVSPRR